MSAPKWTTKHDSPQEGWSVDFDFFDEDDELTFPDNVHDSGSTGVFDENGTAICFVVAVPYDSAKLSRNAALIAAAPDMAEALRTLIYTDDLQKAIDQARAALAKAGVP